MKESTTHNSGQPQPVIYYQLLAGRLMDGSISEQERAELDAWYEQHLSSEDDLELELPKDIAISEAAHAAKLMNAIQRRISEDQGKKNGPKLRKLYIWTVAAAIVLVVLAAFWILRMASQTTIAVPTLTAKNDIAVPGHTGAVLRLANGKRLVLDSLKDGLVFQQGDVQIIKEHGQLKYIGKSDQTLYNDIVTEKGRQWKMYLPDGTEVWLNAGSSLHFPISFKGQKQRIVTLSGEAYFKVVHNERQPFKVVAGNQVIEDIGTTFNVNAYLDEKVVRTTLVEGALKVNQQLLKPGQQAICSVDGGVKISTVNTDEITAWIYGQLSLNNLTVEDLMKQLSRWYNVSVVYKGRAPNIRLGGLLDKHANLTDIVKSLNDYGVPVKLVDKTLIVSSE